MKNNILDLVVDIQFLAFAILLRAFKIGAFEDLNCFFDILVHYR